MNSHWIPTKILFTRSRFANFVIATLCLGVIYFATTAIVARSTQQNPHAIFLDAAAPVYAPDPNDSWNRIFFYLFSRRIETRVTDEFPEFRDATPFTHQENPTGATLPSSVGISTRSFERDEVGDRAVDPLYPSFLRSTGAEVVLSDPGYSELSKALKQALGELRISMALRSSRNSCSSMRRVGCCPQASPPKSKFASSKRRPKALSKGRRSKF